MYTRRTQKHSPEPGFVWSLRYQAQGQRSQSTGSKPNTTSVDGLFASAESFRALWTTRAMQVLALEDIQHSSGCLEVLIYD